MTGLLVSATTFIVSTPAAAAPPSRYTSTDLGTIGAGPYAQSAARAINKWFEWTFTVTVADGRLTVGNATGSSNNKLSYLDVIAL